MNSAQHTGYPENGFQMENVLQRNEALRSITIWVAKAAFEENEKGSLEPGKLADFVLLNSDIMEVSDKEILNAQIKGVWIRGKNMFEK